MDKQIEEMQNELKVLKNQIKETLTDIREYLMTSVENPFPVEDHEAHRPGNGKSVAAASILVEPDREALGPGNGDSFRKQTSDVTAASQAQSQTRGNGRDTVVAAPVGGLGGTHAVPGASPGLADVAGLASLVSMAGMAGRVGAREAEPIANRPPQAAVEPLATAVEARATAVNQVDPKMKSNGHDVADPVQPQVLEPEETEARSPRVEARAGAVADRAAAVDLDTVALLSPWMEDGIRRVGGERMKAIVDTYARMGGLSPQLKDVLLQLIGLDGSDSSPGAVHLRECLRVLGELDNLMWRSQADRNRAVLLSLLTNNGKEPSRKRNGK